MTPIDLEKAGRALYGVYWQTPMAHALSVNPRTVRRWASGESSIPPSVKAWLECETRGLRLADYDAGRT